MAFAGIVMKRVEALYASAGAWGVNEVLHNQ